MNVDNKSFITSFRKDFFIFCLLAQMVRAEQAMSITKEKPLWFLSVDLAHDRDLPCGNCGLRSLLQAEKDTIWKQVVSQNFLYLCFVTMTMNFEAKTNSVAKHPNSLSTFRVSWKNIDKGMHCVTWEFQTHWNIRKSKPETLSWIEISC